MEPIIRFALFAGLMLASAAAFAEQSCYAGNGDSGRLEFAGAVDGSGFKGHFKAFSVRYCMPEGAPADGAIEVEVELASADSGNRDRDQALKGEEFFDIEQFPVASWQSSTIARAEDGYRADGALSLKGITASQPIRFTLDPDGEALHAVGTFVLGGDAEIDRQRFKVGTGEFEDPEFVRNRVDVTFEVTLTRP
ncbi:MAG: YceI family protein [Wenzhouxiangellaceae bacterium]|nr:YceI family protein [Wenzhouxiangellaceae bacterium]